MKDALHLNDIAVTCIIGDLPEERTRRQKLLVNVILRGNFKEACERDSLKGCVDYAVLVPRIGAVLRAAKCRLIERAASLVAAECLNEKKVDEVVVSIRKQAPVKGLGSAEVIITRKRTKDL